MPRFLPLMLLLAALPAHAVIVRGKVTTQLGQPLPGARVQLISLGGGPRNAANTISGVDGSYEIRTDLGGRFLLLTSPSLGAPQFAPQIGNAFYGGRTDLLTIDIALNASAIVPRTSAQATLLDTPLRELAQQPVQIAADELPTDAGIVPEFRPIPGAFVVQLGQMGAPAQLYLRGAPVDKTVLDGVSVEALGGGFNLETLTSTGLSALASTPAIELTPAANPLYGVDATAGVLSLATPLAATLHPVLTYTGDAGNLSTIRNEAVLTVVDRRADALASFARLNTDNDVPARRIHLVTSAANLGYHVSANTSLRLTLRDDVDAAPLPSPFGFYGIAPATRLATQNLAGGFTFETRTMGDWHNLLRYGLVRQRSQAYAFAAPAVGLPVSIAGANGYSASGVASFVPLPVVEFGVTDRDEYTWQTDYPVARSERYGVKGLLTARYQDERGADLTAAASERLERVHFALAVAFEGEVRHRFFYEASGFLDHASQSGWHGSPRLGLTYAPVLPGMRKFRGTSLHFTAATGVGEPSVLASELLQNPPVPRSRTLDFGVEQTILPRRLSLRSTYFHSQFSHQQETLGVAPRRLSEALAYRAQGLESALRYEPATRILVEGGYTYLAALVERTASVAAFNPNLPAIAIGATSALAGARPFERPANSGFLAAQFTGTKSTASLKATFAGRSDDSTGLVLNPTLLLPNRNLSPGYASLDAAVTYKVTHAILFFTSLNNLLNQRHIAPLGFVSTPFAARVGLRITLGHE